MNFSFTSRSLLALGLLLSVPLLTGANGSGCGTGDVVIGNDNDAGGGGASTITCNASSCGAEPLVVEQCPDGTTVAPVCGLLPGNACGWTFPQCPAGTCTTAECGPLPPFGCSGGAVPTPVCGKNGSGVCGWTVPSCPVTTCNTSDCGAEPAIEVDCNGVEMGPICEPTSAGQCGWVLPPCVSDDAGAPCTKGTIKASDYDQACTTAADCVAVIDGNLCGSCFCPNAAINQSALSAYNAGVTAAGGPSPSDCFCPALPPVACTNGVCTQ
jgi:hypothetical protein